MALLGKTKLEEFENPKKEAETNGFKIVLDDSIQTSKASYSIKE